MHIVLYIIILCLSVLWIKMHFVLIHASVNIIVTEYLDLQMKYPVQSYCKRIYIINNIISALQ